MVDIDERLVDVCGVPVLETQPAVGSDARDAVPLLLAVTSAVETVVVAVL